MLTPPETLMLEIACAHIALMEVRFSSGFYEVTQWHRIPRESQDIETLADQHMWPIQDCADSEHESALIGKLTSRSDADIPEQHATKSHE